MSEERRPEPSDDGHDEAHRQVLGASAVMAAGTIFSRLSGVIRAVLLAAALGTGLQADVFNIANTVPNMIYILVAGGVFNAVLVPQLVRTMKVDADGGQAYLARILTAATIFLLVTSVLLVVAAPWVAQLYLDSRWDDPALAPERASVVMFLRYCLPQVFFYGMFVLVGQVLNARGVFGPMMWAPIANNVVSVAILVVYLVLYEPVRTGGYTTEQELLLGVGSTLGIAIQLFVLAPWLRKAGVSLRPRFDLRGTGLGHTLRLGWWTVLFVIVNQIAYLVVVRLASSGVAEDPDGAGYTIYELSFLIAMVPHSVITVSLATAILPRMSASVADGNLGQMSSTLMSTTRLVLAAMVTFAALLPVIARDLAQVMFDHGGASATYQTLVPSLSLFGLGMLFFTVHYLMLRGFYSLEDTRTVFFIQCWVALTNVLVALVLVRQASPTQVAAALVLAYTAAYVVGSTISATVLSRRVGGLQGADTARWLVRLLVCVLPAAAVAYGVTRGLHAVLPGAESWLEAGLVAALAGLAGVLVVLALARPMQVREVNDLVGTVAGRLLPRKRA